MKGPPRIGTTGEIRFTVEVQHAIDFAGGGMPAVLSTPWLIWYLEHAARAALLPLLEAGESTVGTYLEVQHLAPTAVGQSVTCRARIVHADGPSVAFQLEARDEQETVCRGFHRLRVISIERFARRVHAKTGPTS